MPTTFLNFGPELDKIYRNSLSILKNQGDEAATEQQILAALASLASALETQTAIIVQKEQQIFDLLQSWMQPPLEASKLKLMMPSVTRKGVLLMAYSLKNDWVVTASIVAVDDEGTAVPLPDGVSFSVMSSDDTMLHAEMGVDADGHPAVVFNAMVRHATGLSFTVHDDSGTLPDFVQEVDIVEDFTPTGAGIDLDHASHTMQPLPAA